jgi:hypothetical protein
MTWRMLVDTQLLLLWHFLKYKSNLKIQNKNKKGSIRYFKIKWVINVSAHKNVKTSDVKICLYNGQVKVKCKSK